MITLARAYIGAACLQRRSTTLQRNGEHSEDCVLAIMSFVKQQEAGKKFRVIGAGLMGTGTASLKLALEKLPLAPCYHSGHAAVQLSTPKWLDIFDNNGGFEWICCDCELPGLLLL